MRILSVSFFLRRNKNIIKMGHAMPLCGQQRPRSDCTPVQSDLGFCCSLTELLGTVE